MLAEIAASPATIARYGLTRVAKRAEDAAWQARFVAEPGLRMKWMRESWSRRASGAAGSGESARY
ncbi:hypothetical protein [Sorangium sp. So ce426]